MSRGERILGIMLKNLFCHFDIIPQHTISRITFDYFIPNMYLLVEFDGVQHDKASKFFHKDSDGWKKQQVRDLRRWKVAKANDLSLIIIKEKELNEDAISDKIIKSYTTVSERISNVDEIGDIYLLSKSNRRKVIKEKRKR